MLSWYFVKLKLADLQQCLVSTASFIILFLHEQSGRLGSPWGPRRTLTKSSIQRYCETILDMHVASVSSHDAYAPEISLLVAVPDPVGHLFHLSIVSGAMSSIRLPKATHVKSAFGNLNIESSRQPAGFGFSAEGLESHADPFLLQTKSEKWSHACGASFQKAMQRLEVGGPP